MKRIVFACASFLMLFATLALAEPAVVVSDESCTLLDGDSDFIAATDTQFVFANNSKDGNYTFKCSAKEVDNSTGGPVKWDNENTGLLCFIPVLGQLTDDWFENVSTTGNATLTCRIHFSNL